MATNREGKGYDVFGGLISETTIGSAPSRDYIRAGSIPVAQIDRRVPIGDMLALAGCASSGADGKIDWVSYLHTDGLGTPRLATDVKQRIVWRWEGEAFGATPATTNLTPGAYPVTVNLRYPGQYYDFESGLFYNRARYYDPHDGRYEIGDPLGLAGGIETYAYVRNEPLKMADPSGLSDYLKQCTGRYSLCANGQNPDGSTFMNWLKYQTCKEAPAACCEEESRQCYANAAGDERATAQCAISAAKCMASGGGD